MTKAQQQTEPTKTTTETQTEKKDAPQAVRLGVGRVKTAIKGGPAAG